MNKFSQRSLDNLKGVHPDLVLLLTESIKTCPVDFTIVEGVRTTQRQKKLYAQGRSTPGIIVTTKDGVRNKSNHQPKIDGYGHAVDLYPFFEGSVQVNHKQTISKLKLISAHLKKVAATLGVGLTWGGDWRTPYDPPHFELK